jgi:benzylsuccinate CoA-transferase BbsF subunit
VIKVETRRRPDLATRDWIYPLVNTQKLSCTLDISKPEGRELAHRLVGISDVVVENFSTGTMQRLGLSYDTLHAIKPDLVIASASAFGRTGPAKDLIAYGSLIQAFTGWGRLSSYPADAEIYFGGIWGDPLCGVYLAYLVMAALAGRRAHGSGAFIDLSMAECILSAMSEPIMSVLTDGVDRQPIGNLDATGRLQGCYQCGGDDDWVALTVGSPRELWALCDVIDIEPVKSGPQLSDYGLTSDQRDRFDRALSRWAATVDADQAVNRLRLIGIAAARVAKPTDLVADRHLRERGFFARVEDEADSLAGSLPWITDGYRPGRIRRCPDIGEHNGYVFGTLLNLSDPEVARLKAEGVIN